MDDGKYDLIGGSSIVDSDKLLLLRRRRWTMRLVFLRLTLRIVGRGRRM